MHYIYILNSNFFYEFFILCILIFFMSFEFSPKISNYLILVFIFQTIMILVIDNKYPC